MREIKEKRMQSYFLRAKKMVQEGKNKEGAEMLSEGLNYYSKNIIKALTPSVFVLWHTEGVNITSNSHDIERGKTECKRDYHRCGCCTVCRASCICLRQRFE